MADAPLYLRNSYTLSLPVSEIGAGKTITAKICATDKGDPPAIGSLSGACDENASTYALEFDRATLLTDLATRVNQRVWLHIDDGVEYHARKLYRVTDGRSPDT